MLCGLAVSGMRGGDEQGTFGSVGKMSPHTQQRLDIVLVPRDVLDDH
jgi:hypothetical protein